MLGVGFGEMVLIAGVALVVIGPEKFPEFAKIALRTFRDLRGYVEDAKRDISKELRPLKQEVNELSRINPEDYIDSLTGAKDTPKDARTSVPAAAATAEEKKADPAEKAEENAGDTPYVMAEDLADEYKPYGSSGAGPDAAAARDALEAVAGAETSDAAPAEPAQEAPGDTDLGNARAETPDQYTD